MQIGRGLNQDDTVTGHTTRFGPNDTVYVSVQTTGVGSGTLSVRWIYNDRVVGEPKKEISYRDVAATSFTLKNAGGLPPGEYKVEAFLNGTPAANGTFRVETK